MRRADRLFQIILLLRAEQLITAKTMADRLQVSERTIYRDIADLMRCGTPIEGEAGVGYALKKGFDLPPLMFTEEEITAISLGAQMVSNWTDEGLAAAAKQVLDKVSAVLPQRLKPKIRKSNIFAPNIHPSKIIQKHMAQLRPAINRRNTIKLIYRKGDGEVSNRRLRPLCLAFIAPHWLLTGWCELRNDFRNFRLDRILSLKIETRCFEEEPGRRLEDFLQSVTAGRT